MEFAELIKTPKVDQVILHRPFRPRTEVVLCITSHHMILSSRTSKDDELWVLHVMVYSLERRQTNTQNSLVVKCKDWRTIQLDIKRQDELKSFAEIQLACRTAPNCVLRCIASVIMIPEAKH